MSTLLADGESFRLAPGHGWGKAAFAELRYVDRVDVVSGTKLMIPGSMDVRLVVWWYLFMVPTVQLLQPLTS